MLSFQDLESTEALETAGFIRTDAEQISITHPYIRDLVHLSIPAEIRRSMHARALEKAAARGAPLVERAEHAFHAGETMSALMLMERLGGDADVRGDSRLAVIAFQRALELARREMLETGDISFDNAIATFSRRLGRALLSAGDAARAAGVVLEAMDLVGPQTADRARMQLVLAEVAVQRDRPTDARHRLDLARSVVEELGDQGLRIQLERATARVCRASGDILGACNALSTAWELGESEGDTGTEHARVALDLADELIDIGDTEGARERLTAALAMAQAAEIDAISARAMGALASLEELDGDPSGARARYKAAGDLAGEVGDVEAVVRWRRAAAALS